MAVTDRQQFVRLCDCGCGQPTRIARESWARYGWRRGQPLALLVGHYLGRTKPAEPRFWAKVDARGDCWEWTASLDGHGYGQFKPTRVGTSAKAHRFAYENLVGPIPEGMVLDHLCRNRRCVNPDHLQMVTQLENKRRGEGLAARRRRQTSCKNGHPFTRENTYRHANGCRECLECRRAARRPPRARKAAEVTP